jgi:pimeloyl-ACP methyl ester carboxylesterase
VIAVLGWIALSVVVTALLLALLLHFWVIYNYLPHAVRIFQEKPLFITPYGQPVDDAEFVRFPTGNGLTLCGCYLPARTPRKGVIVFGLEFGSNRWSCVGYCDFLRDAGYDVFSFEPRGQGESDSQPGYEPLQWVTNYDVEDFQAVLTYLKSRPDADPRGVGLFGLSKGASAGLMAGAGDPYLRCAVTDGAFACHTTMVPYMQRWVLIYCHSETIIKLLPVWYYRMAAYMALTRIEKQRGCSFPHLEEVIDRLAPRPLFMIHGGGDNYIKPYMAQALFEHAGEPKQFWLVERAKHNHAFQMAGDEYKRRVLEFFDRHLASAGPATIPASAANVVGALAPMPTQPSGIMATAKTLLVLVWARFAVLFESSPGPGERGPERL